MLLHAQTKEGNALTAVHWALLVIQATVDKFNRESVVTNRGRFGDISVLEKLEVTVPGVLMQKGGKSHLGDGRVVIATVHIRPVVDIVHLFQAGGRDVADTFVRQLLSKMTVRTRRMGKGFNGVCFQDGGLPGPRITEAGGRLN